MKNIYIQLAQTGLEVSEPVLATVTATKGSTPQKPGSSALFGKRGLAMGTVGGGFVENMVLREAEKYRQQKKSALLTFSLDNDISRKEAAICGGTITILLDADPLIHLSVFKELEQSLAAGIPGVLVTVISRLKEPYVTINRQWITAGAEPSLPDQLGDIAGPEISTILSSPDATELRQPDITLTGSNQLETVILEPIYPPPRLVIAGAGHIGKALSHLGRMLDFEVTVIDSRKEYANPDNLPDADHIITEDITDAMQNIEKNKNTFIVIVTHGHADDARALKPCIGSGSAYIGMIGSRGKIAKMHEEFIMRKWATEEEWSNIFTPIGIDIGSKTVEEIAVSIAAELIKVRRGRRKEIREKR